MQPRATRAVELLDNAESEIAAGNWIKCDDYLQALAGIRFQPEDIEMEQVLSRLAAVLLAARVAREHLRHSLRSVNAGRNFQSHA